MVNVNQAVENKIQKMFGEYSYFLTKVQEYTYMLTFNNDEKAPDSWYVKNELNLCRPFAMPTNIQQLRGAEIYFVNINEMLTNTYIFDIYDYYHTGRCCYNYMSFDNAYKNVREFIRQVLEKVYNTEIVFSNKITNEPDAKDKKPYRIIQGYLSKNICVDFVEFTDTPQDNEVLFTLNIDYKDEESIHMYERLYDELKPLSQLFAYDDCFDMANGIHCFEM